MSKLILHVGTHKTGTTSTQDTLALNRSLLERNGVIYPEIGKANGQHGLVTEWIDLPKPLHLQTTAVEAWKMLGREHGKSDRTVLISSEELSRSSPNMRVDMAHLRVLCSAFDEVRVVCFLRNQATYMQSLYLEIVKGGRNIPWHPIFTSAIQRHSAVGMYLDYKDLRQFFETGFSANEIRFFSYEQACKEKHGVIGRILVEAGHEALIPSLQRLPNGFRNVSPDPLMTWVASRIVGDKTLKPWLVEAGRNALTESLGREAKTTIFSNHEYGVVEKVYTERNLEFERAEQAIGYPVQIGPFFNSDETFFRNELNNDFWIRLAQNLYGRSHNA